MRVWDISPRKLCNRHLIAEHHELHAIWSILINGKKGYRQHPETKRWAGKTKALYRRHERLVEEMRRRGYRHRSPLDKKRAAGKGRQDEFVNTRAEQRLILKHKNCACPLR